MKTLKITIHGKESHDLVYALEEVKKSIERECTSGFYSNDDGNYNFDIKGTAQK